jgi:5-methylcytosine-specific restriction endonuclease McrA
MRDYSLSHLSDAVLLRDLVALVAQERITIADVLAHIAEVDARKLFVPAGYSSMYEYCVHELHLSEDAAYKRIQAARAARRFPILFTALAEGRLHMTAVCLLAPHLTPECVEELVEGSSHRRKSEIEDLLVARFQLPSIPGGTATQPELAPEQVEGSPYRRELAPEQVGGSLSPSELAPGQVEEVSNPAPSLDERLVQLTIRRRIHDKLRYAQALMSHAIPSGDVSEVLDRALDLLIANAEKRKLGTGTRSLVRRRTNVRTRYIPSHVRRAVWKRDEGQCTFVGTNGHRCNSWTFLEFDHVNPYARGGESTVQGLRLRCRAHNQFEAERTFGAEFMERKREEARLAAEVAHTRAAAEMELKEQTRDVLAALRGLGLRGERAHHAAAYAEGLQNASLADRIRAALEFHGSELIQRHRSPART